MTVALRPIAGACLALVLGNACAVPPPPRTEPTRRIDLAALAPPPPAAVPADDITLAGHSVEGRPIQARILGHGPRTVLIMATIHGDEAAGTPLLEDLASELASRPELLAGRRAVLVPVVNPDGFADDRRANARGVDLNRDFPASNRRAPEATEHQPETRALLDLIDTHDPALIVSVHGWVGLVDWDGPGESVATAMGSACGLPAKQLGARPGSLGSFLGKDAGVPVITLELPYSAQTLDRQALWRQFGPALLVALGAGASAS
jgi:protein MpaA